MHSRVGRTQGASLMIPRTNMCEADRVSMVDCRSNLATCKMGRCPPPCPTSKFFGGQISALLQLSTLISVAGIADGETYIQQGWRRRRSSGLTMCIDY